MLMSLIPWLLYLAAWGFALVIGHNGEPLNMALLHYVVIFNGGLQGLWAALGHLGFPQKTAASIGWKSNGFQVEIGFANLGIGITGTMVILAANWSEPIGLFIAIYYAGCAYNHIKERFIAHNNAPCNSGPMLYSTIATVITILLCLAHVHF